MDSRHAGSREQGMTEGGKGSSWNPDRHKADPLAAPEARDTWNPVSACFCIAWELSPFYPRIWGSHRALDEVRLCSENFSKHKKEVFGQATKEHYCRAAVLGIMQVTGTCKPKSEILVALPYLSKAGQRE